MTSFSPREIVSELDRYIVGQKDAKRAVAIALRNRWRRQQLTGDLKEEVLPKNILMIGPTGCGKTEISRRLARLAGAPFLKVEATKFTEVGYVGRDVEFDRARPGRGRHRPHARGQAPRGAGAGGEERRGARARRPGRSRRVPRHPRELPPPAAQQPAQRQGGGDPGGRGRPAVSLLRHSGRPGRHDQSQRDHGQGVRPAHQAAQALRRPGLRHPRCPGERQAARPGPDGAGRDTRRRERRHRVPRRDRQDLRALGGGTGRRGRLPRGRAARPAAADRRHHGVHQVRPGEDRPRAVHRLGRLPCRQALRPAAGAAGPIADPRRAEAADDGGSAAHPDRAGGEPHQAVHRR